MNAGTYIRMCMVWAACLAGNALQAQDLSLSGNVSDQEKKPVADAVVQLLRYADSSLVKSEFSTAAGMFEFKGLVAGAYFLQINVIGYAPYTSAKTELSGSSVLPDLQIQKSGIDLKEVTVAVRQSYIERDKGKVILNVENSINAAGSSAFELIEKAPGVRVDNNDNVSLNGKQGVAIWIDGRPTPMTGADLANYLRGMPSNAIEKIEMISNPSAKFDAAGSSIINIKLKKDKRVGTNGSISSSYGQGVYPKTNHGISLNHRNKRINVYGSYNYAYRLAFTSLKLERKFYNNDTFLGAYKQDNYLKFDFSNHIARGGIDYYVNKKNTIGFVVSGSSNTFNPQGDNTSLVYDGNNAYVSLFKTANRSNDHWMNYSANLNYKHQFDSLGTELSTDLDYAHFGNTTKQNFTTRYYAPDATEYRDPYLLHGDLKGGLDIYSLKNDFVKTFHNELKLEAGQKSSYVIADNNLAFYNRSNDQNRFDSSKSNHFIYTENINAAYINVARDFKAWTAQLGLRCEHTHVTGKQLVYNTRFVNDYIQLFPSAFVTYKVNDKNSLELNYSRRIARPSYEQLNPFKFYLDPTTYKEGNPYLNPQTTESVELTHVLKQKVYTTIGYSRTNRNITEVIAPADDQPKVTVQTNKNLSQVDMYTLNCSLPLEPAKWWHTAIDVGAYYAFYTGTIANTSIRNNGGLNFNVNVQNTFNFTSRFSGELTANYRSREIYAFDYIHPIGFLSAGVQHKLLSNRAVLKLNLSDLFYSNVTTASTQFTDYTETFRVSRDTRVATVSFTYKFGKNSVPASKRRQGGADDIKQRAGGGGVG